MKRFVTILFLIIAVLRLDAAQPDFEIGVILGDIDGLSMKLWMSEESALDFAAAWDIFDERLHIHGEYLHHARFFKLRKGQLPAYLGFGGVMRIDVGVDDEDNGLILGLRIPAGVSYIFEELPLSLFLEVGPRFDITDSEWGVDGGLGIRYIF
ncbi:MAG: hypothetical protein ACOC41_01660 [Chitinivibrionales bacterium]